MIIREILVDAPEITIEGGLSGSNLGKLQKNLAAFSGPSPKTSSPQKETRLRIDRFTARNGKVHLRLNLLGGKETTLPLPDLQLKDIGRKPGGATAQEAAVAMLSALTSAALKTAGTKPLTRSLERLQKSAGCEASQLLKGLFKK